MQEIDQKIIDSAAAGDREAFEMIYQTYKNYIYTVIYRMTRNIEDAQEIMQDVFVQVYRNLPEFRSESSLKTWMYRIAINVTINSLKKRRKPQHTASDLSELMDDDHQADPRAELNRSDLVDWMMKQLNPQQRSVMILRSVNQLSYQEIADVLQININNVRTLLKRAREHLANLKHKVVSDE